MAQVDKWYRISTGSLEKTPSTTSLQLHPAFYEWHTPFLEDLLDHVCYREIFSVAYAMFIDLYITTKHLRTSLIGLLM